MQLEIVENPPAPKVPFSSGRDEWTVCQSGTASAGHAPKSARDFGNLHVLQIGPTSSKCTVSIRHGRNIGPTWGQLRHNLDPLGSNHLHGSKMAQLGPNMDPFGRPKLGT